MMKLLRKHRDWLMIVIAILALPFVFYFVQKPDYGAMSRDQVGQVYGHTISVTELAQAGRMLSVASALGMNEFAQQMTLGAQKQERDEFYKYFISNLFIVRHEAEQLGIRPSSEEVVDYVRNLPAFRGPSGFDPKKYEEFTGSTLGPNGFTESQIEELVRDALCLNRIKQLLTTGVTFSEADSKEEFEQLYGKSLVSVIRLHAADFAKDVKLSDDEVQKYYDAHKAEFKTEEKRKIAYVKFGLTDEQKKLTGKERIDALSKLSDRAEDFTQALLEKGADFQQVAAKMQLPVQTTSDFSTSSPDQKLKANPKLSGVAFQLTKQEPNSDVIEDGNDYYILHLAGIAEARPLTFEEAKQKIVDTLKNQRERELLSTKGAKVVHDVRESLKSGLPFVRACEQAGVKAEKQEPFTLIDDQASDETKPKAQSADLTMIRTAVSGMQLGEVSDLLPSGDGGMIVFLEKRDPPEPSKYQENKAAFDKKYLRNKGEIVFYEWLHDRQVAAGVQFAKS